MRELVATPALRAACVPVSEAVSVEVVPGGSYVRLQISPRESVPEQIDVLGTVLNQESGSCGGLDPIAWWLAPRTWLIASRSRPSNVLVDAVGSACTGLACAIVDVSDSLVALEVRGPSARELLARGTGFDVRAASFRPGRSARVAFAQLAVLLRPAEDSFELLVDRSAAQWLIDWLSANASGLS
jgi:sarcosine oxidase subunit gamma